jgi:hypothetical protein
MSFQAMGRFIFIKVGPKWGRFGQKCLTFEHPRFSRYQRHTSMSVKRPISWVILGIECISEGDRKISKNSGKGLGFSTEQISQKRFSSEKWKRD